MSSESPNCSSTALRSNHNTGYWEHRGVGALGRAPKVLCLWWADVTVPDQTGGSQTEVLQLLSREPDCGNRSLASVVGAGKQLRPRGHKGELAAKSVTGSLSPVKPMASEPAQRELWNYYPQRCSNCRCMTRDWGGSLDSTPKRGHCSYTSSLRQTSYCLELVLWPHDVWRQGPSRAQRLSGSSRHQVGSPNKEG